MVQIRRLLRQQNIMSQVAEILGITVETAWYMRVCLLEAI